MKREFKASQNLSNELRHEVENELKLGYINLEEGMFAQAKENFELVLSLDPVCAEGFWGKMLEKCQIQNENELLDKPTKYKNVIFLPECENALKYATNEQKKIYENLLENVKKINDSENF